MAWLQSIKLINVQVSQHKYSITARMLCVLFPLFFLPLFAGWGGGGQMCPFCALPQIHHWLLRLRIKCSWMFKKVLYQLLFLALVQTRLQNFKQTLLEFDHENWALMKAIPQYSTCFCWMCLYWNGPYTLPGWYVVHAGLVLFIWNLRDLVQTIVILKPFKKKQFQC